MPSATVIGFECSRRQVICGCGDPVAAQVRLTEDPSLAVWSVLVPRSKMSGGTASKTESKPFDRSYYTYQRKIYEKKTQLWKCFRLKKLNQIDNRYEYTDRHCCFHCNFNSLWEWKNSWFSLTLFTFKPTHVMLSRNFPTKITHKTLLV